MRERHVWASESEADEQQHRPERREGGGGGISGDGPLQMEEVDPLQLFVYDPSCSHTSTHPTTHTYQ